MPRIFAKAAGIVRDEKKAPHYFLELRLLRERYGFQRLADRCARLLSALPCPASPVAKGSNRFPGSDRPGGVTFCMKKPAPDVSRAGNA